MLSFPPKLPASTLYRPNMPNSLRDTRPYHNINIPARWICLHLYYTIRWLARWFPGHAVAASLKRVAITFVLGWTIGPHTKRPPVAAGDGPQPLLKMGDPFSFGQAENVRLCLGIQSQDDLDGHRLRLMLEANIWKTKAQDVWERYGSDSLGLTYNKPEPVTVL